MRIIIVFVLFLCLFSGIVFSQTNQCSIPPFVSTQVSPLVMIVMSRDHKLYYEAYNDASDINEDGLLDVEYNHSIDYYGYFDPHKCYRYDGDKFIPTRKTNDKYCGSNEEWSGNFLNWLSMSRMDILRKVLYGGYRQIDSSSETVLEGTYIPQDAHSWGKEYNDNDTRKLTPFEIDLSSPVEGQYVAPALHYKINNLYTLCKSGRDTGGCQPLADNVVDFQIAYRDIDGNWYCDSSGSTCPMDPFDPLKIDLIRVSLIVKTDKKTKISKNPWPLENRNNYNFDPDFSYRVYSIEVAPRNLIYNR